MPPCGLKRAILLSDVAPLTSFVLEVWHLSYKGQHHIYLVPERGGWGEKEEGKT